MDDLFGQFDVTKTIRDFEYTRKAGKNLQKLYESENFDDCDSEEIFRYLSNQMEVVSFGNYLKRYIYERAGLSEAYPFKDVPEREYQEIITDSFRETQTPVSTTPTTKKVSAAAKSWLNAESVRRETVILLGFGLRMSLGDVSEFLTKVIKERDFDLESPTEAIYFHCFWNEKKYLSAKEYLRQYESISKMDCKAAAYTEEVTSQMTEDVRGRRALLGDEAYLLKYLTALKSRHFRSITETAGENAAYSAFSDLYRRSCQRAYDILSESYDEWKKDGKTADDVTPADLEKILCSGIPTTKSGNLEKSSAGMLGKAFGNYRLSRQRIDSLLKKKADVERTDLITMEFFLFATDDAYEDSVIRFEDFRRSMNQILERCHMYRLYVVNPYETFILMCTLTEYPLGSYNDIWEYSYER